MLYITNQKTTESNQNKQSKPTNQTLDGENEGYGYGVYNTEKDTLISKLGIADPEVFDKEEALEHFKEVTEDTVSKDFSHLRIVEVRLANELDEKASEQVKEQ